MAETRSNVVIVNEDKTSSFDIDLAKYPNSIVFSRPRRIRDNIWDAVFKGYDRNRPLNYLEVGCQEGGSMLWFLDNFLQHPQSRATAVDAFVQPPTHATFLHNMRVSGYQDKVTLLVGNSGEHLRPLPLYSYDIIYIDGLHATFAVLEDVVLCWRLLKNGGVLIFDDYEFRSRPNPLNWPKVAVDAFLYAYQGKYSLLAKEWQVVVQKTYPDGHPDRYLPDTP